MPIKGVDLARVPDRFRAMFANSPFADTLDLEVVTLEPGHTVLRFPWKRELTQYQGTVQGGIVVAYADAAMAFAVAGLIPDGRDFVTTDLTVQFVRPFMRGFAVADANVEHMGKTLGRGRATVRSEEGVIVAYCTATFMVVDPRGAMAK